MKMEHYERALNKGKQARIKPPYCENWKLQTSTSLTEI